VDSQTHGSDGFPGIGAYFTDLETRHCTLGLVGEIIGLLAAENLNPAEYERICRQHGVAREPWFRRQILDLVLGHVSRLLENGPLDVKAQRELRGLQRELRGLRLFLNVRDGEFQKFRPAEVAALLGKQFERILEDFVIDDSEELQQVELQAVFGLSYDDYLTLIRAPLERVVAELSGIQCEGSSGERSSAMTLSALEPMYRLATKRRRTLGALY
jgi:hypothetical protein